MIEARAQQYWNTEDGEDADEWDEDANEPKNESLLVRFVDAVKRFYRMKPRLSRALTAVAAVLLIIFIMIGVDRHCVFREYEKPVFAVFSKTEGTGVTGTYSAGIYSFELRGSTEESTVVIEARFYLLGFEVEHMVK